MASGDPPITGNPVDASSGTITIEATPSDDNDNLLRVRLFKNSRLQIVIDTGDGTPPVTVVADAANWFMTISEID